VADCQAYRQWLDEMIVKYPELFPENISDGYLLHDERNSAKLENVRLRRICLKAHDTEGKEQVFTIAPSGVIPYFPIFRPLSDRVWGKVARMSKICLWIGRGLG
jgi:hypothetical protein